MLKHNRWKLHCKKIESAYLWYNKSLMTATFKAKLLKPNGLLNFGINIIFSIA